METHAHELHKAPGHGWKHYFFEFFMLFLAVSLGFYAENLREEIKNERELKTNLISLVTDLKSDILSNDSILIRNSYSSKMADSLIWLLRYHKENTNDIYYAARVVTANFGYFYANSKTFDQMKSSGLLKLIEPRSLLDSIGTYYTSYQAQAYQTELARQKINDIHAVNDQLFDAYIFQDMMTLDYTSKRYIRVVNRPRNNPPLLTQDITKMRNVALRYHYYFSTVNFYNLSASLLNRQAKSLIKMIEKEYYLEKE